MKTITLKEGERFGRLTVICEVEPKKYGKRCRVRQFLYKCDCGNETIVGMNNLRNGVTRSCGCLRRELNRGFIEDCLDKPLQSRLHNIWLAMRNRCNNKKGKDYRNYTSKGITVCDEWKKDFLTFYNWAIANGYSDNLSIDRINNDKGYYPDNCRWATAKQQVNNTRVNHRITFNGETHTVSEWAQILNVTPMSIFRRLYKGWSEEEALTIPRFGKRTIQKEPMTTQDVMNVCKQSISCGLCKNKKEFCEMSGMSKYVFFSIQKGKYKISDGIYLKVKAMQDKILKIKERKEK